MKIKGTYRKIIAMLIIIAMLFQQAVLAADAREDTVTTVSEAQTTNSRDNASEEDTTEDLEEDTTEDIPEAGERPYTVADYANYAYSCPALTAVEAIEQVEINTDEKTASGNILVFGDEGEALVNEFIQQGTSTIYKGTSKPASIILEYTDDITMVKHPFTAYDLFLFEESATEIGLTSQEFLTLTQLTDIPILYDKTLLYKLHTTGGSYHFDDTTGTLLINTAEPFAGTESYRSGGIKHERPLSIKGV
ncbi:MAG: hypothetical protein J6D02_11365, partial [Lachnospira sp.]|nr:hypothetical protein [Lachnospira sp.]